MNDKDPTLDAQEKTRFDTLIDEHWDRLETFLVNRVPMPEIQDMAAAILTAASVSRKDNWPAVRRLAEQNVNAYYTTMCSEVKKTAVARGVSKGSRSVIAQEVVAAFAPKPNRPQTQPRHYFWGVFRHKVADYFRGKKHRETRLEAVAAQIPSPPRTSSIVRQRILAEELFMRIPDQRQRKAVRLRHRDGHTIDTGAAELGVSRSTFKRDVEQGMAWMREHYGLETEELILSEKNKQR